MDSEQSTIWKCIVWGCLDAGMSRQDLIDGPGRGLSRQTLSNYIGTYLPGWRAEGLPHAKNRSGRPRVITDDVRDDVEGALTHGTSTRKAAARFSMSEATVRRIAKERDLSARVAQYGPSLSKANYTQRLLYAKKYIKKPPNFFRKIAWSDECAVSLQPSGKRYQWVYGGEEPDSIPKVHWATNVWVWAAISGLGATPLVFIKLPGEGGFNSDQYQKQVLSKYKRKLKQRSIPLMPLMEDGATCHTAKRSNA